MNEKVLSKTNLYDAITAKIVAAIEEGPGTFKAPWHVPGGTTSLPVNASTHAQYKGVNVLSLWIDAQLRGYAQTMWASYRQWQMLGAQVRKGERGSLIIFYKRIETRAHEEEDHEDASTLRYVAKASYVFNAAQVDGFVEPEQPQQSAFARIQEIEAFVGAINATVRHGFASAQYRRDIDEIQMPHRDWFHASDHGSAEENYYAVLFHELTHWTGAEKRLHRMFGQRFGDEAYAMEELVAEIGAAFLCSVFGISAEPRPDHAAYVGSWLKVLRNDNRAIFAAASKAQEAYEHLAYLATTSTRS